MKKIRPVLAGLAVIVALVGADVAVGGASTAEFAPFGAVVLNFGNGQGGRAGCSATCGGAPCVVGGKISLQITPSGHAGLNCNNAFWTLGSGPGGIHGTVNCGFYGSGGFHVTPSNNTNYFCKNTN